MDQGNSYLGFRGSEDLGGGLKAIWQIEQGVVLDTGGGIWAQRDSFLGLSGGFGTIRLGNIDTVYKRIGDPMSILGVSSGNHVSSSNMISKGGFGTSSTNSFNLRRANSIAYESPEFGGFQVLAQYSPDENRYSTGTGSTASTTSKNAELWSIGAKYTLGGLYLALAQEMHKDLFAGSSNSPAGVASTTGLGTTVHSKDTSTRASASYEFGNTKIGGDVVTTEYKETGGAAGTFASQKHNGWLLGVSQKFGNMTGQVNYARSEKGSCTLNGGVDCSTAGLDGKLLAAGLGLNMSKRTMLFALYSRLENGASAQYSNSTSSFTPNPGADLTHYSLGVSHSF
jgi:predicted porin